MDYGFLTWWLRKYFSSSNFLTLGHNSYFEFSTSSLSKFWLVPMGVLAPGFAHAWPSAQPLIDTSGIFLAHMSGGRGRNLDNFLINFIAISGDSRLFSFLSSKKLLKRGAPNLFSTPNLIFLWVKTSWKFQNPRTTTYGRKVTQSEETQGLKLFYFILKIS